jgi:hypothetical protein
MKTYCILIVLVALSGGDGCNSDNKQNSEPGGKKAGINAERVKYKKPFTAGPSLSTIFFDSRDMAGHELSWD